MLAPTLVTAAVLRSVDILRFFDVIYLTTQGGPGNASTTLNILAYRPLSTLVFGSVLVLAKLRRAVSW